MSQFRSVPKTSEMAVIKAHPITKQIQFMVIIKLISFKLNYLVLKSLLLVVYIILFAVEDGYGGLEASTVPEMQRSDLAPVILQMKALGVSNIVRFNFLSVVYLMDRSQSKIILSSDEVTFPK